eukprot:3190992-Pyramimonas_sp.AAC.1
MPQPLTSEIFVAISMGAYKSRRNIVDCPRCARGRLLRPRLCANLGVEVCSQNGPCVARAGLLEHGASPSHTP